MSDLLKTGYSRLWIIEDRASPANVPELKGNARGMGPSQSLGDRTAVREPDPGRYGGYQITDAIKGEKGLVTIPIEYRAGYTRDAFLELARKGCPFDIQLHYGQCEDPTDFQDFQKIMVFEAADISNWAQGEQGAFEQGSEAIVTGTIDTNALDHYEVFPIVVQEIGASELVQEVVAVSICDSKQCGACGIASDGCQAFIALTKSHGGSPGLPAEIIFSTNGGATLGQTNVDSLTAAEDPTDGTCSGSYYVVVSNESGSLHYAPLGDLYAGIETWAEVLTGFVGGGEPNAIFSMGSAYNWIVGDGGYIYFTDDVTSGVTPQSSGGVTTQDLAAIHGVDMTHLVAVGALNVVLITSNGGTTWSLLTGPAVGVSLTSVWMKSRTEWLVGTADGRLFYTRNSGLTWTVKAFAGSGAGAIEDIKFATDTVGYMSHTLSGAGRLFRTYNGGQSWKLMPDGQGTVPANDKINSIGACGEDVNRVYAGGLGANGTDGMLLVGA